MSKDAESGLSAIQLALVFLTGVAVCAVFFAMGFVVGRNQQPPTVSASASTEQVPAPGAAPTPVNGTAGATTSEKPISAGAPTEEGGVSRSSREPSPGSSTLSTAPPPAPPTPIKEAPKKSESKPQPVAPIPPPKQLEASNPAGAPNLVAAPPSRPSGAAVGGKIVVQVSATGTRQDAERLVDLLKSRGYPAFLVTPEAAGAGDKLFRVQVGPYKSDPEAVGVRNKLVADGFKPFVRH